MVGFQPFNRLMEKAKMPDSFYVQEPFYQVNENYFKEYKNLKSLIISYDNCIQNNNCLKINVKKRYGFYIFEN